MVAAGNALAGLPSVPPPPVVTPPAVPAAPPSTPPAPTVPPARSLGAAGSAARGRAPGSDRPGREGTAGPAGAGREASGEPAGADREGPGAPGERSGPRSARPKRAVCAERSRGSAAADDTVGPGHGHLRCWDRDAGGLHHDAWIDRQPGRVGRAPQRDRYSERHPCAGAQRSDEHDFELAAALRATSERAGELAASAGPLREGLGGIPVASDPVGPVHHSGALDAVLDDHVDRAGRGRTAGKACPRPARLSPVGRLARRPLDRGCTRFFEEPSCGRRRAIARPRSAATAARTRDVGRGVRRWRRDLLAPLCSFAVDDRSGRAAFGPMAPAHTGRGAVAARLASRAPWLVLRLPGEPRAERSGRSPRPAIGLARAGDRPAQRFAALPG